MMEATQCKDWWAAITAEEMEREEAVYDWHQQRDDHYGPKWGPAAGPETMALDLAVFDVPKPPMPKSVILHPNTARFMFGHGFARFDEITTSPVMRLEYSELIIRQSVDVPEGEYRLSDETHPENTR